jgi:hypothetical protein
LPGPSSDAALMGSKEKEVTGAKAQSYRSDHVSLGFAIERMRVECDTYVISLGFLGMWVAGEEINPELVKYRAACRGDPTTGAGSRWGHRGSWSCRRDHTSVVGLPGRMLAHLGRPQIWGHGPAFWQGRLRPRKWWSRY